MSAKNQFLIIEDGTKEKIWQIYGKTRQDIDRDIAILKEWLKQQPHLPDDEDDYRLERMLISNKFRVEKTKNQLENLYTFRSNQPEIMQYFDLDGEGIKSAIQGMIIYFLPKLTKNLERVICFKIKDAKKIKIIDLYYAFIYTEYLLQFDYSLSYIFLLDMDGLTLDIVKELNFNVMSLFINGLLYAFAGKFAKAMYINSPSYFPIVMAILKAILKPKMYQRLHNYQELEKVYETIPREHLPKDYGGDQKSVEELWSITFNELQKEKQYLKELMVKKSNEKLRIGKIKGNELFGTDGTFKKLNLD